MSRKPSGPIGINIGASKESIQEARAAILAIMNAPGTEAVAVEALRTLAKLCDSSNASVTNCSIDMGGRS